MQEEERPRFKIARADAKGKILDWSDPNPAPELYNPDWKDENGRRPRAPRIAMNYVRYDTNSNSALEKTTHWIDYAALGVLCRDLLYMRKGAPDARNPKLYEPLLHEYKGGQEGELGLVSRELIVTYADHLSNGEPLRTGPVYQFRFKKSPGTEGDNGQIMPVKGAKPHLDESISIRVSFAQGPDARTVAHQILEYLQAKQTAAVLSAYVTEPLWRRIGELSERIAPLAAVQPRR